MIVITKITAGCKNNKDTFPHNYEVLPEVDRTVYSIEKHAFIVQKIIYEPNGGVMMPVVVLIQGTDKVVLCGNG